MTCSQQNIGRLAVEVLCGWRKIAKVLDQNWLIQSDSRSRSDIHRFPIDERLEFPAQGFFGDQIDRTVQPVFQ